MSWGDDQYKTYFQHNQMVGSGNNSEKTDTAIKFCEVCENTWESYFCNSRKRDHVAYYGRDIPSIGKARKNCQRCASKKASELVKYQGV